MPNDNENIIKTRDDSQPVRFFVEDGKYKLCYDSVCSWHDVDKEITKQELRNRIEPWLTALLQSEHLSLVIGSGLTHAIHHIVTGENAGGMDTAKFSTYSDKLETEILRSAKVSGRKKGNIEDQVRIANELLRGLDILKDAKADSLAKDLKQILSDFSNALLKNENSIMTHNDAKRELGFSILVSFLMTFASRNGSRDRLNIFTTNYDRLIEAGCELAGLHLIDRFLGKLNPVFRSSRLDIDMHYNPPGIRGEPRYLEGVVRYTKLHGSIDWVQHNNDIRRIGLPFGATDIKPYLQAPGLKHLDVLNVMIYPNAAKDMETTLYPYADLFRDFASSICRPNNTLVCYGAS
jgi:hypothetical protein